MSNTKYFEGVPRIPRTVLDAHREGLILGSACSEGEVFDVVVSQGVDAAVEVAKYYDFIEVMPPAIYAPLIAKEQVKDMEELQTIIKSLIEVGDRLGKPVLATGNVHYIEPEEEIYREIIVRSLGQGAMINRTIGHGEHAQPAPLPKAHFRTTNEMLDEFAFWERNWLVNWLLKTPMPWQKYLNPLKSLRVTCIRLSSTRLKKQLLS